MAVVPHQNSIPVALGVVKHKSDALESIVAQNPQHSLHWANQIFPEVRDSVRMLSQEPILSIEGAVLCWDQEPRRLHFFGSDPLHQMVASLSLRTLCRTNHLSPHLRRGQKARGEKSGSRGHLWEPDP